MRVMLCPADDGACGHYRLIYPGKALEAAGLVDVEFERILPIEIERETRRVVGVKPIDVDVLVLQRPLHRILADSIPFFQRAGVAVVVDIDDDFTALHPKHRSLRGVNPGLSPEVNYRHLQRACARADLVTVSTDRLAERFAARGHGRTLHNRVPEGMLTLGHEHDEGVIGWAGFVSVHPEDLKATGGGVASALADVPGSRFRVLGDGLGVQGQLSLPDPPEIAEPVPFYAYGHTIARFDVGIAPLIDSAFNDAKSWLKPLEYAAVGVPSVVSPRASYMMLSDMYGIGVVAGDRGREWKRELKRLLTDRSYYGEVAERGRAQVQAHHTVEKNAWRWLEAWGDALDRRQQHLKAA